MSSRPRRTNEQLREQSRERILAAAVEVFTEKGFHDATISDITSRAGVSRGLITYYFPGKNDLLEEFLDRFLGGLVSAVDVTGSPDERLAAMIDGILGAAARTLPVQRFGLGLMILPSTHLLFAQVEMRLSDQLRRFEDTLRAVFRDRGSADPALDEVVFRSVLEGVIFKLSVYNDGYPLERVRVRLYEMYDLPAPSAALIQSDPPPVGRMRAADPTAT